MNNKIFSGIMPALVTPFDEHENLIKHTVRELMDWQLSKGIQGFYICGNTGEGTILSTKTRMEMAETVMDNINGKGVIIDHIMASNFHETIVLAKHAEKVGVQAISALAPMYFFQHNEDELVNYYKEIAEAVSIPLLVYATPQINSVNLTNLIQRLMEVPNICGLKFTRPSYYELHKLTELNDGNINVINGPDEMLICGLLMGADGGIGSTYNLMAEGFVSLYNSFCQGDIKSAREMQFKINRVIDVMIKHDALNSGKFMLSELGFDIGYSAFPRKRFEDAEKEEILIELREAGFFRNFALDRQ